MNIESVYVVLIDADCVWPDVVFVGSWEDAVAFDRTISDEYFTSIQAVVTLDEVDAHSAEAGKDAGNGS